MPANNHPCTQEAAIAELESEDRHLRECVEEHHRALYGNGNGNAGLVKDVDRLKVWKQEQEEKMKSERAFRLQVLGGILVAIILGLLNLVARVPLHR